MSAKKVFFCCFILLIAVHYSNAQQLKLKDIAKMNVKGKGGINGAAYRDVEVVRENNTWKAYDVYRTQFNYKIQKLETTADRRFIRDVDATMINQLLEIIAHPDTVLNLKHSGVDRAKLLLDIDSLDEYITPAQKIEFANSIKTDSALNKSIVSLMHGVEQQDDGRLAIKITTLNNQTDSITTGSGWTYPEYLPHIWYHGKTLNYNIKLQSIFAYLHNDSIETKQQQKDYYKAVDIALYRKYFETRFKWAIFKQQHPALFAQVNKTLVPVEFTGRLLKIGGDLFHSRRLPPAVFIAVDPFQADSAHVWTLNNYADTLAMLFSKPNFLFTYLKNDKGARAIVIKFRDINTEKVWFFNNIRNQFPMINLYDIKQMHFIRVVEADGNLSHWVLFGDKLVVLAHYTGDLKGDYMTAFNGITPDLDSRGSRKNVKSVCILFDNEGKHVFGNTDKVFLGLYF